MTPRMTAAPITALSIIALAAAFHLHWALGGQLGYSVSLPQSADGQPVMAHRLPWWRWGAAAVTIALLALASLVLGASRITPLPLPYNLTQGALFVIGSAFIARALVPTPWTGFFKTIRSTRWARYDSWLYSPLFLVLGGALLAVATGN